ncbi:hypothetical protein [Vibrio cyclitrophicus]|uniref:hypothetical protein n=1 Tax=Vibrio cyclitrophicus TaxID=47951 RepID=UPI0011B700E6|nr:hypothetical protein [Vibrio cyclitrophicus]
MSIRINRKTLTLCGVLVLSGVLVLKFSSVFFDDSHAYVGQWSSVSSDGAAEFNVGADYIEAFGKRLPVDVIVNDDGSVLGQSPNQNFRITKTTSGVQLTVTRRYIEEPVEKVYELTLKQ